MNAPPLPSTSPEPATLRLVRGDGYYPMELEDLGDEAPGHIMARGSFDTLSVRPRVAIVGTRRATAYGQRVTRELSGALARAGACIVSGLAAGIDGTAHRAALDAGGATIAVLGTGLNVAYPRAHRQLQDTIAAKGLLLSELESDENGMPWTFPKRNRIIAAIAAVTIVVEAGNTSGALGTADRAYDLGRELGIVPGPIDQPQSVGTNRRIQQGAFPITSIEDALSLAGLTPPTRVPRGDPDGDEGRVWAALAGGALDADTLCLRTGLPASRCMAAVTTLELNGSLECAMTGEIRRR